MQDAAGLAAEFGIDGVLAFGERNGLVGAEITTPAATATVYLHGAHLAAWQPAGEQPVLYLSERSEYAAQKAIRGGVPVIFPWFGDDTAKRAGGAPGPAHGFARTSLWTLQFAALAGEDLHLSFGLGATELSRSLGFDRFRAVYQMTIGRTLRLQLTVANEGEEPLVFEEALHTYLAVGDVRQAELTGLAGCTYLDKTDGMRAKVEGEAPIRLTGPTDRIYEGTTGTCAVADPVLGRSVTVEKKGSATTVVWNPSEELSRGLADMDPEGWRRMLCVETVNARESRVQLERGQAHTMEARISVAALQR